MIDQNKVDILLGLVQRGRIDPESIKDPEYKEAVLAALVAGMVVAGDGGTGGAGCQDIVIIRNHQAT